MKLIALAIVVAGALIGGAIVLGSPGRYAVIAKTEDDSPFVYVLNTQTGRAHRCSITICVDYEKP